MAPLPPVANVIKAEVRAFVGSIPMVNIFHLRFTGASPSPGDLNTIALNVGNAWNSNITNVLGANYQFTEVVTTDISSLTGAQGAYLHLATGGVTGAAAPNSACALGSWVIATRYRGGKPRTYLSGLPATFIASGNTLTTAAQSAYESGFTGFLSAVNGMATPSGLLPVSLGCVHYQRHHVALTPPVFEAYTGVATSLFIRSQRGRLS